MLLGPALHQFEAYILADISQPFTTELPGELASAVDATSALMPSAAAPSACAVFIFIIGIVPFDLLLVVFAHASPLDEASPCGYACPRTTRALLYVDIVAPHTPGANSTSPSGDSEFDYSFCGRAA
jgi:hypothetical protein